MKVNDETIQFASDGNDSNFICKFRRDLQGSNGFAEPFEKAWPKFESFLETHKSIREFLSKIEIPLKTLGARPGHASVPGWLFNSLRRVDLPNLSGRRL